MDCINEESSAFYWARLRQPAQFGQTKGDPVTKAQLAALWLTLFDDETLAIVNGRNVQNVLDANNVTVVDVTEDGATIAEVRWKVQPADTVILDSTKEKENRIARFDFEFDDDAGDPQEHKHEVPFQVKNLHLVPST